MPSAEEAESLEMKLMRKIQLPGRLAGAWRGTFGWTEAGHEDSIRDTALSTAPRRGSAAPSWRSAKEWATRGHKQFPNSAVAPKLLKGHLLLPSAFLEATKCMCFIASQHAQAYLLLVLLLNHQHYNQLSVFVFSAPQFLSLARKLT